MQPMSRQSCSTHETGIELHQMHPDCGYAVRPSAAKQLPVSIQLQSFAQPPLLHTCADSASITSTPLSLPTQLTRHSDKSPERVTSTHPLHLPLSARASKKFPPASGVSNPSTPPPLLQRRPAHDHVAASPLQLFTPHPRSSLTSARARRRSYKGLQRGARRENARSAQTLGGS